jgi:glutathione S-transferase
MKLYDSPRAPNPRRVRWLMAEKGLSDIEIVPIDLLQGEHKQPDYLARSGLAQVPALQLDDGTTITESLAICRYLEHLYPEPNMFGLTPKETAVIEVWTRRAELLVGIPLMLAVRHTHPALAVLESQSPPVAEYNMTQANAGLEMLDRRLAESEWIGAERLTIADIVAFVSVDFARLIRYRPAAELANLQRWIEAMGARDAAKVAR